MTPYHHLLRPANFIAGQWHREGTEMHEVRHKWTHEIIAAVPMAGPSDLEEAIACSVDAAAILRQWSAEKRSQMLDRLCALYEAQQVAFAELICAEAGKPITYARAEAARCLVTLRAAQVEALRLAGEVVPLDYGAGTGRTALTQRFPIGPIAAISPFNFPLNLALHKLAPALAVGCSVVLKPSPYAPLSALAFAALVQEAGYPDGTLSVLLAHNATSELLVRDERMKMFSFTGSPAVGWMLKGLAGKKRVALELGGNAAVIVDETADLDKAAKLAALGSNLYAGQVCIATQRIYVTAEVAEEFMDKLTVEMAKVPSGDPHLEQVVNGPLISAEHLQRISTWVKEAVGEGAKVLAGGKVLDEAHNLYAPTLLTHTHAQMRVVREEVFGPVAIVESVGCFDIALEYVNNSAFGLQAGVFTQRIDRMKQAFEKLDVGGVIMNHIPGFRVDTMPYGGIKDSGLGREGIRYAIEEMTEPKLLVY
jgi:glyceraldehyde-3-phosphate dehydrogenase (NADP+)